MEGGLQNNQQSLIVAGCDQWVIEIVSWIVSPNLSFGARAGVIYI